MADFHDDVGPSCMSHDASATRASDVIVLCHRHKYDPKLYTKLIPPKLSRVRGL